MFSMQTPDRPLNKVAPDLERLLTQGGEGVEPRYGVHEIRRETVWVRMRDGIRLATDLYFPPERPAPVVVMRTPYSRNADKVVSTLIAFARRGYAIVSQDCRGTGDSEPDIWDYYMFESEDGYDLIDWISNQDWFGGFIGSFGASYVGQTQWAMATHPAMSTIVPHVSGLGIGVSTVHLYMFCNGYAQVVGKGTGKLAGVHYSEIERLIEAETMSGGFFNKPLHEPLPTRLLSILPQLRTLTAAQARPWLWKHYCSLSSAERADFVRQVSGVPNVGILEVENLSELFGHQVSHDAHALPSSSPPDLCREFHSPPLMITGWYDWCLHDALATWSLLRREGARELAQRCRIIITPHAHNTLGYREGLEQHPELRLMPGVTSHSGVILRWYQTVRNGVTDCWPTVIYYLMGANQWRVADDWPLSDSVQIAFYLQSGGKLTTQRPLDACDPDSYTYDPNDPTPTVGGSILSYVYTPGSVDVSELQGRSDILVYTSDPLEQDLDIVGPLRMILYASSSAVDTDFGARLCDVFPDGRAIQLQNSLLRARYRSCEPELLEADRIYRLEIDMWATANRFKAGHQVRVDISSADFPRFDRNANRGGSRGDPIPARQRIYHDESHPSHLLASIIPRQVGDRRDHSIAPQVM